MNESALLKEWLAGVIAKLLVVSPFRPRRFWSNVVVVLREKERRITTRGDFAHWLIANDLRASANECLKRRVADGSILVWIDLDAGETSGAGFFVFDLKSTRAWKSAQTDGKARARR